MTNTSIGHGSTFARGDGADPEVFTDVAEVLSISGPSMSRDAVEVTHMTSTDRFREFVAGLKDAGEVSIECNFDPDGAVTTQWLADFDSDVARNYQITFPDTTEWVFSGFMTALAFEDPMEDKMTASITYKITGKPGMFA